MFLYLPCAAAVCACGGMGWDAFRRRWRAPARAARRARGRQEKSSPRMSPPTSTSTPRPPIRSRSRRWARLMLKRKRKPRYSMCWPSPFPIPVPISFPINTTLLSYRVYAAVRVGLEAGLMDPTHTSRHDAQLRTSGPHLPCLSLCVYKHRLHNQCRPHLADEMAMCNVVTGLAIGTIKDDQAPTCIPVLCWNDPSFSRGVCRFFCQSGLHFWGACRFLADTCL